MKKIITLIALTFVAFVANVDAQNFKFVSKFEVKNLSYYFQNQTDTQYRALPANIFKKFGKLCILVESKFIQYNGNDSTPSSIKSPAMTGCAMSTYHFDSALVFKRGVLALAPSIKFAYIDTTTDIYAASIKTGSTFGSLPRFEVEWTKRYSFEITNNSIEVGELTNVGTTYTGVKNLFKTFRGISNKTYGNFTVDTEGDAFAEYVGRYCPLNDTTMLYSSSDSSMIYKCTIVVNYAEPHKNKVVVKPYTQKMGISNCIVKSYYATGDTIYFTVISSRKGGIATFMGHSFMCDSINRLYVFKYVAGTNTGINDYSDTKPLEFYPNPVVDVINIKTADFRNKNVEIFDITGRLVKTSTETTIDVANLQHGAYIVKSGLYVNKFIKQ